MGQSGVLLAAGDEPEHWAQAIEEILGDRSRFASLAASALANAQRAEFEISFIAAHAALAEMPEGAVVRPG